MRIGHEQIIGALGAALEQRGLSAPGLTLIPIDPPRPWGVASNACFMLGKQAAAVEIEQATAGLDKKAAKQKAGELAKAAGEKLASEIARELNELCGGGAGPCPGPSDGGAGLRARHPLPFIAKVEAEGAYINFYYDIPAVVGHVVANAAAGTEARPTDGTTDSINRGAADSVPPETIGPSSGAGVPASGAGSLACDSMAGTEARPTGEFGHGAPTGQRIMVEYAQPNTHKDFHVGHLRNASIGQAIANLLEFAGNDVLKATYIGDVGKHVAKAVWGWSRLLRPKYLFVLEKLESSLPGGVAPDYFACARELMTCGDEDIEYDDDGNQVTVIKPAKWVPQPWGKVYTAVNRVVYGLQAMILESIEELKLRRSKRGRTGDISFKYNLGDYSFAVFMLDHFNEGFDQWLQYWESDDIETRIEWNVSRKDSLLEFKTVFEELLVSFTYEPDCWFYESTVDDTKLGQATAAELKALGIAEVDESAEYKGALYVDFAKHVDAVKPIQSTDDIGGAGVPASDSMAGTEARPTEDGGRGGPPHQDSPYQPEPVFRDDEKKRIRQLGKMTILRSDGTSLYQTKELGLAKHKFDLVQEKFGAPLAESLYVVGAEQKLYFEQVFAILRLWGFPNAERCKHIAYELVVLPEGKMSSREGNIVSYRELRDEAVKRAIKITEEKGIGAAGADGTIDKAKVEDIARKIAIAAIKYAMLKVTGAQQIVFDFEEALSFSGRTAPYLQYAYARAGKLIGAISGDASDTDGGSEIADGLEIAGGVGLRARQPIPGAIEDFSTYRHRLPHWRLSGSVYFVTWRVHPEHQFIPDDARSKIVDALKHFDGDRYKLYAYCVMDDHVHVLVQPLGDNQLEKVIWSWKSFTANQLQRECNMRGSVWQDEYMDRIVRDEDEFWEKVQYILNNPAKRWTELREYQWVGYQDNWMAGTEARPTSAETPSPIDGGRGGPPHQPGGLPHQTENPATAVPAYPLHESEVELARRISLFPDVCADAAAKYEPATLCNYLYDLADGFSAFYRDCRVLDAEPAEREFRQQLVAAFRNVVRTGFTLLALPLPEEM